MSISRQNLSVIIVSFKSDHVIHRCINSIDKEIEIVVIDNSNNAKFKKNIEEQYKNVKCILSSKNIGMGAGNNIGIKSVNKDFALILNPDVTLEKDTINEIINASKLLNEFGVIAPISDKLKYPNYRFDKNENHKFERINPFKVETVDGYSMLLNLKRLKELDNFNFFDENFFLYFEEFDLCKSLKDKGEKVYSSKKLKIHHLGLKSSVDENSVNKKSINRLREWHWMWSSFYFYKKNYNYFYALNKIFGKFVKAFFKLIFYILIFNKNEKEKYKYRFLGILNGILCRPSSFRDNSNNFFTLGSSFMSF